MYLSQSTDGSFYRALLGTCQSMFLSKSNSFFPFLFANLILGLLLFFGLLTPVNAKQNKKSQARQWFEYAYSVEEQAPQRAMQMYAWALEKGLQRRADIPLARITYWRLYYLYLQRQHYLELFLLLEEIQKWNKRKYKDKDIKGLKQKLSFALQKNWKLSKDNISLLFRALHILNNSKEKRKQNNAKNYFVRVLQDNAGEAALGRNLLSLLVKKNKIAMAKEILDALMLAVPSVLQEESYLLRYAALQVEEKAYKKAGQTLEGITKFQKYRGVGGEAKAKKEKNLEAMQFYYLWGCVERGLKNYSQSARYFEKAASFGQRQSLNTQAAYSLYLDQKPQRAWELLSAFQSRSYTDEELLRLVLEVKLAKASQKKAAKRKLKKMRPYLEAKSTKGHSLLARNALAFGL